MMTVEEGDILMRFDDGTPRMAPPTVMDRCLNNPKQNLINLCTFCLAMGNAADAVEIMCIGFIMTELDVTQTDKGSSRLLFKLLRTITKPSCQSLPFLSFHSTEFLSAAVFFGMFFGGIFCGLLSDRYGRRPCLLYSLALNTIAGLASCFVPNVKLLIFCRVIGGVGIGGSVPAVFSLGAEIFPSSVRGKYLSIIASFWMVGAIFVGAAAWIMLGSDANGHRMMPYATWRWFAAICSLPALAAFLLTYFFLPESPRFLIENLRFEEAAVVLNRLSVLKTDSEELRNNFTMSIDSDDRTYEDTLLTTTEPIETQYFTIPKMFSNRKLVNVSLTLMVIWFTLSFGSYGISTWISTIFEDIGESNPYEDSFIFAAANLPGNIVSILFVDRYGRKNLLFFGMFFSSFCSIGFAVGKRNKELVVFCAALFNAFSVVGWNSLDCLSVEMFPTAARTSAMGILAGAGNDNRNAF